MDKTIKSTREIRRTIRTMHCKVKDDQKCHIVGLNLMKEILNYYAKNAMGISEEEMKQMVIDINKRSNIRCCSPEANTHDKEVERELLDLLIEGTRQYGDLSPESIAMFEALESLLKEMNRHLLPGKSPLFTCLLEHLEKRHFPLPLFCFNCYAFASNCEVGYTRIFCNLACQKEGANIAHFSFSV